MDCQIINVDTNTLVNEVMDIQSQDLSTSSNEVILTLQLKTGVIQIFIYNEFHSHNQTETNNAENIKRMDITIDYLSIYSKEVKLSLKI